MRPARPSSSLLRAYDDGRAISPPDRTGDFDEKFCERGRGALAFLPTHPFDGCLRLSGWGVEDRELTSYQV